MSDRTLYELDLTTDATTSGVEIRECDDAYTTLSRYGRLVKVVPCVHGNYARHPKTTYSYAESRWCDGKPEADND